jgi:hypothetical protein
MQARTVPAGGHPSWRSSSHDQRRTVCGVRSSSVALGGFALRQLALFEGKCGTAPRPAKT